ncbi:MAG: zinc finger Ran-binding domain-containing protein, partial [Acidobacteriota bacterium]|nr:zinc finger Ran-binding domain-containing protein [Acidobacteriota bacterium]
IREGAWDCSTCGRTGNRGPEKYCAGCGHPRGSDVELYLPEDAAEVTDDAALDRARTGPDWSCDHCGGDNRADADYCTGCGAPGEGAATREVVVHREESNAQAAQASRASTARRPSTSRRKKLKRDYRRKAKGSRKPLAIGCIVLVAAIALITYLGRTSESTATVSGFGWERTIAVEKLLAVTEEAKQDEVPQGARLLDSGGGEGKTRTVTERVQVGTEQVKVGVRDLGNGFFEDVYEERPVYKTRRREASVRGPPGGTVRYQIDRWSQVREEQASGRDRAPRWPDVTLGNKEREGKRSENYTVYFSGADGETLTYRASSEQEWLGFAPTARYRVEATKTGRIRSLAPR